jgi:hypothetical protein
MKANSFSLRAERARLALVVPRDGLRRWQVDAVKRAERLGAVRVDAVIEAGAARHPLRDGAVELLAALEFLFDPFRARTARRGRALRRRCAVAREWPGVPLYRLRSDLEPLRDRWPLVVNLTAHPDAAFAPLATTGVLSFSLGASRDLEAVLEAFGQRRTTVEIGAWLSTRTGAVRVRHAVAGLRERTMFVPSLELVLARGSTVLARAIADPTRRAPSCDAPEAMERQPGPVSLRSIAHVFTRAVAEYASTAAWRIRSGLPTWFLAFRESPEDFVANTLRCSSQGLSILMPPPHHFHADPCVLRHGGADHVFFEDFDRRTGKGVIAWMQRVGAGRFTPAEVVLERSYHLSYPFVFTHGGDVYMVPETSAARRIELYRAVRFPREWERAAVLVDDVEAVDATLVEHQGRWWMFASVGEASSSKSDELFVYYASDLRGPWRAHAQNPVKSDVRSARPAGKLFHRNGRLIRPAQNCSRAYGGSVALCEVLELTPATYRERVIADLDPVWPPGNTRFHTLSSSDGLEFIDGNFPPGVAWEGARAREGSTRCAES